MAGYTASQRDENPILMHHALKNPIRSLPSVDNHNQASNVLVHVLPMSERLAHQWHVQVQPLINTHYVSAIGAQVGQATRADVGWNWMHQRRLAGLHSFVSHMPGNASGPAIAVAMVIDTGATGPFPIGMLTSVPKLYCNALGVPRHRGFAWYLADAPGEVYSRLLQRPYVKGVAKALLDCGIQAALDQTGDGTFLLHADAKGGARLQAFYRSKCGMDQLPTNSGPITQWFRRGSSDEYFHFDDVQAQAFCAQFNPRR